MGTLSRGSAAFPVTADAFQSSEAGRQDALLARFTPNGQLTYATYYGGSNTENVGALTVESNGVVWIGGETYSANLPVSANAYQGTFAAVQRSAFVARIDTNKPGAAGLTYATFFGRGPGNSTTTDLFLDSSGQLVFCGSSLVGVPATTPTAFQPAPFGRPIPQPVDLNLVTGDGFIARLNPLLIGTVQLTYASHVGGTGAESNVKCGLDRNGNFLVAGMTDSGAPFFTAGSPQPFKVTGGAQGSNLFLIRIDPRVAGGPARLESIIFGGNGSDFLGSMFVDATKTNAYLIGLTASAVFPNTSQATQRIYGGNTLTIDGQPVNPSAAIGDVWLAQVDLVAPQVAPVKLGLVQGDYQFVNPGGTLPVDPAVQLEDATGKRLPLPGYLVEYTGNNATVNSTTAFTDSEGLAGVVVRVTAEGPGRITANSVTLTPYTFNFKGISGTLPTSAVILSGSGQSGKAGTEVAQPLLVEIRDATGAPLQKAGIPVQFRADNVTVSAGVVETDALGRASTRVTLGTKPGAMKVTVVVGSLPQLTATFSSASPLIDAAGVVNAATFLGGPVSPGLIITIFGEKVGPPALTLAAPSDGKFPVLVGETRVLFDGVPAPVVYVSSGQTSVIVPYAVAGKAATQMVVEYQGVASNAVSIPVAAARPGLFSSNSSGTGQGALLNQDNTVNSAANPLARGRIAVLFATGEGETEPTQEDGLLANTDFPKPKLPVRVRIGGVEAEVLYAGAAPTLVAGVLQVNVRIPAGTPDGNAIVELFVGTAQSPATITIAVKGD